MGRLVRIFNKRLLTFIIISLVFVFTSTQIVKAEEIVFTKEEKDYLAQGVVLKAVSIDGAAPLHYKDCQGEIKGIAVNVLDEIASMTGLVFEYHLYESTSEALDSGYDIVFGLSKEYATPNLILSKTYLEAEIILYYNKSLDPKRLAGKRFATVKGGTLPEGIAEENAIFYNDREAAIDAVEKGQADYGLGNAYSVAFYTLQNNYKNLITIPTSREERHYCMGVAKGDEILLSILNKSITAISENRMETLILDVASKIDRKITFAMIMEVYAKEVLGLIILAMMILIYGVYSTIRSKNQYKIENRRYEILSKISNESIFEYQKKTDSLKMSDRFYEVVEDYGEKGEILKLIRNTIKNPEANNNDENNYKIRLPLTNGDLAVFKIISSNLKDESGKIHSVIGKLIDISEAEKEKEMLVTKSQLDGLTELYNATTTKELVVKSLKNKGLNQTDALMIMDCDKFKEINDNYGHLQGDIALENISKSLKLTFRQTDIIGRIGGDEFCVYMRDIPSVEFIRSKCQQLSELIKDLNHAFPITVSIGVGLFSEESTYEELFKKADDALYVAKDNGGAQVVIYGETEYFLSDCKLRIL